MSLNASVSKIHETIEAGSCARTQGKVNAALNVNERDATGILPEGD